MYLIPNNNQRNDSHLLLEVCETHFHKVTALEDENAKLRELLDHPNQVGSRLNWQQIDYIVNNSNVKP